MKMQRKLNTICRKLRLAGYTAEANQIARLADSAPEIDLGKIKEQYKAAVRLLLTYTNRVLKKHGTNLIRTRYPQLDPDVVHSGVIASLTSFGAASLRDDPEIAKSSKWLPNLENLHGEGVAKAKRKNQEEVAKRKERRKEVSNNEKTEILVKRDDEDKSYNAEVADLIDDVVWRMKQSNPFITTIRKNPPRRQGGVDVYETYLASNRIGFGTILVLVSGKRMTVRASFSKARTTDRTLSTNIGSTSEGIKALESLIRRAVDWYVVKAEDSVAKTPAKPAGKTTKR
jgi:hypothetical protein